MEFDITCCIVGHREGRLAVASLRSFWAAIDRAESSGLTIEPILMLDRPDDLTRTIFERSAGDRAEVSIADFGDQGLTRNSVIDSAQGTYTAFLDADDLWTEDWLEAAHEFLKDLPATHIAHPEFNCFFEGATSIFCQIDQEDPAFDLDVLRFTNYWDALCLCPTRIYRDHPFAKREIAQGWAYEDWHWNCETIAAGCVHKIVPDTLLFKRRQKQSQTIRASANASMHRVTDLASYSCPLYVSRQGADG